MKRLKIETDGTHYYPFVKIGKKWEPIENYYVKENNKSAYETAYNDYNRQNNISNNPISKNDAYNNPNIYKNSNM